MAGVQGGPSPLDQLEQQWEDFRQRLGLKDEFTPLLSTIGVLIISLMFSVWVVRAIVSGKKKSAILLLGLNGAGKTALYYQLRDGSTHKGTVTSMEPNEGHFILYSEATSPQKSKKIRPVHLVDVPGHLRLRPKIDEFLPLAAGIVFVVDGLDFMPQVRQCAEYLYDVLTKGIVVRRKIPVHVACNKMDKVTAHSPDFIRRQLEKEIEKLRKTRRVTSDADLGTDVAIGSQTGPFEFTQCLNKVAVSELSVLDGKTETVEHFIREHVKP